MPVRELPSILFSVVPVASPSLFITYRLIILLTVITVHHHYLLPLRLSSFLLFFVLDLFRPYCYDSLSLPPLHFISIGYMFPILFNSPFSISINKLFYFQPFYYSAFYYSAFYYSAFHYSAFLLFSLILFSVFIIQLYYSATFLLV